MLSTENLYEIMWGDCTASDYIMAVAPPSALKFVQVDHKERCYIVNCNEKAYSRGGVVGHWIAIIVARGIHGEAGDDKSAEIDAVEIFDSLGSAKEYSKDLIAFTSKFKSCKVYSKLLSDSNCGYYALTYAYYRARKYAPEKTVDIITSISNIKEHCEKLYATQ